MTDRPFRLPRLLGLLLALIAVTFLCMGAAAHHATAQGAPDCEDPDTIACLPTAPPADGGSDGGAASGAPSIAAPAAPAAAAAPGQPIPCPYPRRYPSDPPYAGGAAAPAAPPEAAPYPTQAYPCIYDVYSAINRANLAYARAMQSLDPGQLPYYWGDGALQDLYGQIDDLSNANSYRTLHLRSIQVVDQTLRPNVTRVHTRERWTTQTWSYDGYQYDSADAWYDNYYTLSWRSGHWVITTDTVY